MFQVVLVPPEDVVAALEPFRRLHDPAFHRHPPHLTLAGPFDAADAVALRRRFGDLRAPSVLVTFDDARIDDAALVVPVRDEAGCVAALAAAVRDAVLPVSARVREEAFAPLLRIGILANGAERELARRSFAAAVPRLPPFVATEAALLVEDVRGLWHEVSRVSLGVRPQ